MSEPDKDAGLAEVMAEVEASFQIWAAERGNDLVDLRLGLPAMHDLVRAAYGAGYTDGKKRALLEELERRPEVFRCLTCGETDAELSELCSRDGCPKGHKGFTELRYHRE